MEFDNSFEVPLPPSQAWKVLMDVERIAPCMPGAQLTEIVDPRTFKGKVAVRLGPVALSFGGTARFEEVDDVARTARIKAGGTDAKGRGGANATAAFRLEPVPGGSKVLVHTDLSLSGSVAQYGRGAGMIQDVAGQIIKQFATSLKAQIEAEQEAAPVSSITSEAAGQTASALVPQFAGTAAGSSSVASAVDIPELADATAATAIPPGVEPTSSAGTMTARPVIPAGPAAGPPPKPISGFSLGARVLWNSIVRRFTKQPRTM